MRAIHWGLIILAAILLPARRGVAQSVNGCLSPSIVVNVRDQQGKLVTGLQSASFRTRFRDEAATIQSARIETGTHRVVLVLDISGSMSKSGHNWGLARVVAGNLLTAAPSTLRVAFVLFSDHVVDTIGFDRPAADIAERLAKLEDAKGRTALVDALDYSADLLHTPEIGDAVYIITDGFENSSKAHKRDVENKFLARGIRLFAFVLYDEHEGLPANPDESPALLSELAEVTGGLVVDADTERSPNALERLKAELHIAYDQMAHFYNLQLAIPSPWAKKEHLQIEVIDEHGKRRSGISVFSPQYLLPCTR
jgi:Mg-chelatase subunit ChlD